MTKITLEIETVASVLKLLGDKTRLSMLGILQQDECCVCEFVKIFNMSQPAISQHLKKVKELGLVKERRRNQWIFYSLNKDSDFYPLIIDLLSYIPDQQVKLNELEAQGLRICCSN